MALVIIAGGNGRESFDILKFDAVTSIDYKRSATITKNPVETGRDLTDHVFTNNTNIDIIGVITNSPLPGQRNQVSGNERVLSPTTGYKRTQNTYDVLVTAFETREIIEISSEFDSFRNCVIRSLDIPRTAQIGESLEVRISLEQIQVVSADILEDQVSQVIRDAAARPKKKGEGIAVSEDSPGLNQEQKSKLAKSNEAVNDMINWPLGR